MSGPKCGRYTVETAEAREAREYAGAVACYEELRLAMLRLRVEALAAREVLGPGVQVPNELSSLSGPTRSEQVIAAGRSAEEALDAARARLNASCARLSRERWLDRARAQVAATFDDRRLRSAAEQVRTSPAMPAWRVTFVDQLAELAAQWLPTADRTVLDEAAQTVTSCVGHDAAALALARVGDEFARQRRSARIQDERRARLAQLHAAVSSVQRWSSEARTTELLAEIAAASDDASTELVSERVAAHVAQTHAQRDRDEAGAIVADVLVEMGYRVGEAFQTRLNADGDVLVGRPGWTDHAVSVRLTAEGTLFTHVVRAEDSADNADETVDAEFCADFDAFSQRAKNRGLGVSAVRRFRPGERAIRSVRAARVREVASSAPQRRNLERER